MINSPKRTDELHRYEPGDNDTMQRHRHIPRQKRTSVAPLAAGVLIFCSGIAATASQFDRLAAVTAFGVPLMLVGLFTLAIGVFLLLGRIRREHSVALDRMRLLDLRLQEYRHAALLVGSACDAGKRPFIEHWVQ